MRIFHADSGADIDYFLELPGESRASQVIVTNRLPKKIALDMAALNVESGNIRNSTWIIGIVQQG
jgi:hypothetical protein